MPGKRVGEHAWRYMTPPELYREVTTMSGDNTGDRNFVDGLSEVIDFSQVDIAYDNCLAMGVILSGGASNIRLEFYVDMGVADEGSERWCLWRTRTGISESVAFTYTDVPPAKLKIMAVGVNAGKVRLVASRTP